MWKINIKGSQAAASIKRVFWKETFCESFINWMLMMIDMLMINMMTVVVVVMMIAIVLIEFESGFFAPYGWIFSPPSDQKAQTMSLCLSCPEEANRMEVLWYYPPSKAPPAQNVFNFSILIFTSDVFYFSAVIFQKILERFAKISQMLSRAFQLHSPFSRVGGRSWHGEKDSKFFSKE